ncbi:N-acetyltransferase [Paenibacillus segetis]|uniref:N-acetyltransferase n=2 Tax=Paenibacillus segetis TaxID=1325360 RepID=A0ABQ1YPZ7_9BACL|nr:N-acetyltransferase [Paenibacillus segetis]
MATVQLKVMSDHEYEVFLSGAVKDYAKDKVEAGTWSEDEALTLSKESFERYLPEGKDTKDAFLYTVWVQEEGHEVAVGYLWFNITEDPTGRNAFIYDILIHEQYQGKGYGKATMAALDEAARQQGVDKISLHVFGHNQRAFQLYQKVGYEITDIVMSKRL